MLFDTAVNPAGWYLVSAPGWLSCRGVRPTLARDGDGVVEGEGHRFEVDCSSGVVGEAPILIDRHACVAQRALGTLRIVSVDALRHCREGDGDAIGRVTSLQAEDRLLTRECERRAELTALGGAQCELGSA